MSHLAWLLAPGCLMWLALVVGGWRTWRSVPKLAELRPTEPASWPSLAIVVPCRDEAAELEAAARSLLAIDYPELRVVLVDDRSRDGTRAIMDRLAAEDPRITVVGVEELPKGWLGKNHALHLGTQAAHADWLLFTDADVHFDPGLMRKALAFALEKRLDHLTLMPDVHAADPLLELTLVGFGRYLSMGQKIWEVSDPKKKSSIGLGAFNLVRRAAFETAGGFERFPLDVADDLALGRAMKMSGAACFIASGTGLLGLQWYANFGAMKRGLEKNTFAPVEFSLWKLGVMVGAVVVIEVSPILAVLLDHGHPWLTAAGWSALGVGVGVGVGMARWMNRSLWPALFQQPAGLLLAYVMLRAGIIGHRQGGLVWRDRFYPKEEIIGKQLITWP